MDVGVTVAEQLASFFTAGLTPVQLQTFCNHVMAGASVCCGEKTWYFVDWLSLSAAPEVLANVDAVPFEKFTSDDHAEHVMAEWSETWTRLCKESGILKRAFETESAGEPLCHYTEVMQAADQNDILVACTLILASAVTPLP